MTNVSVIIPARNAEATIGAALASVAAQTLPPAEVVVTDDGSADATGRIVESWRAVLPVTLLRHEEATGPARARHDGILASHGDSIALLDSDDIWLPDHLEVLHGLGTKEDHRWVATGRAQQWASGAGPTGDASPAFVEGSPPTQLIALLARNFVYVASLFPRSLYDEVGGFRDGFTGAEDWDLWIRMARAGAVFRQAPHVTALYRLSAASLSADGRSLGSDAAVLDRAAMECVSDEERHALERGRVNIQARRRLVEAYAAARDGRSLRARRKALGALRGPRSVAFRALLMAAAPASTVRRRDRRR